MDVVNLCLGAVIGIVTAIFLSLIAFIAGESACKEASGADKCVKEWRAIE